MAGFCTACGKETNAEDRFCGGCGVALEKPLPIEQEPPAPPSANAPSPTTPRNQLSWADRTFEGGRSGLFGCLIFLVGIGACGGIVLYEYMSTSDPPKDKETIAREAAENAENHRKGFHCLSPIDGSQPDIVAATKEKLTDPDSFEHIETRITPANKGGFHRVLMRYRSRNGFGGMVEGRAIGSVDTRTCKGYLISTE